MKMKNVHTPFVLKIRTNVQNNVNNVQLVNKNIYYIQRMLHFNHSKLAQSPLASWRHLDPGQTRHHSWYRASLVRGPRSCLEA